MTDRTAADWGLLYGFGLFETVRVYRGVPFLLDRHLARMSASAAELGLENIAVDDVAARVRSACAPFDERVVRVTVTAGNPDLDLPPRILVADRPVSYTAAEWTLGIAVTLAAALRSESSIVHRHKTLNQLDNLLARRAAERCGCREALFFNTAGHLAEGSCSNVFVVKRGQALTPPTGCGILPGITRGVVIDLLRHAGVPVRETVITRDELLAADECFLTNAVMEVMPVHTIGGASLPTPPDDGVTRLAARSYRDAVRAAVDPAAPLVSSHVSQDPP